jgi:hypothetical protein
MHQLGGKVLLIKIFDKYKATNYQTNYQMGSDSLVDCFDTVQHSTNFFLWQNYPHFHLLILVKI